MGAGALELGDDAVDLGVGERRDVLAEVDGEIGLAVCLVRGDGGAGNRRENLRGKIVEPPPVFRALRGALPVASHHGLRRFVVVKPERAVLADHGVNRPHARDVIAPSRRPAGDGHHLEARRAQPRHGVEGDGVEPALGGQCIVDVGEHVADRAPRPDRKLRERPHQMKSGSSSRPASPARSRKV